MSFTHSMHNSVMKGLACLLLVAAVPVTQAQPGDLSGTHPFYGSLPDGCKPEGHAGYTSGEKPSREAMMQKLTDEFGLTGQQQQDLQVLVADYAERLQQIATQMRTTGERLANTEPDDPYYWPLAQDFSAQASAAAGESVILLSELRQKVYQVLTAEQRAAIKQRIEEAKARCKPAEEATSP